MLTRRTAADLLARLTDASGRSALASALGFPGVPVPLDAITSRALGLPEVVTDAALATGPGSLRALLATVPSGPALRPLVTRLAHRLAARSPHQLWLLLLTGRRGHEAVVAAWRQESERVRVCALVLDPRCPLDSDAETVLALHAASGENDLLTHARWCEILGRDALSHRFYRALERGVMALGEGATGSAPGEARRELALLATSRLLFLSFLQGKGWLDGDADFLARRVDATLASGGDVHRRLLEPLFFGTLNTPPARRAACARALGAIPFLNGGLFARAPLERRHRTLRFRDQEVAALFDDVFTRFRFTAREERREWTEAAIDPEMLGRAFESLMASRERRDSGAYYTPHALVARVSDVALDEAMLAGGIPERTRVALRNGARLSPADGRPVAAALRSLRILDPACGTGAFLVHLLERLTTYLQLAGEASAIADLRREVLTGCIFGVDVNPMAGWLCELRLWLAVVLDLADGNPHAVPPLPNLDRNIRVGDALAGGAFAGGGGAGGGGAGRSSLPTDDRDVCALRARYARAQGARKHALLRRLDGAERRSAIADLTRRLEATAAERRALVTAARGRDLFGGRRGVLADERAHLLQLRTLARALRAQRRALQRGGALPFRFASHYADVAADGGFHLVVGNPPWVRLHRIPADRRDALRREFRVFRDAAWRRGATDAGAGAGFAAQVDLAALFAERGAALLRPRGVLALLLPIKLWRSLAGGGVRRLLGETFVLRALEDWSEAPASFDAAVYPSLVVAARPGTQPENGVCTPEPAVRVAVHRREMAIGWSLPRSSITLDQSPGAPWLVLPPDARAAFARLADAGPALAESGLGRPLLGVKSGCNAAFLVRESLRERGVVRGEGRDEPFALEPSLLRPVLRGDAVRRWRHDANDERIVWTHGADGRPLRTLPPLAARWLARWRGDLARRSDVRAGAAWWSLFRVEGAANHRPRVVWADMSRGTRACILTAHIPCIPLNSCYVIPCRDDEDAATLAALLNSPLAASWLDAVAEPARGGFRRYLGWTVARLPLPADWDRARSLLAPLGVRGMQGEDVADAELLEAAIAAYRVRAATVRPLVEWTWR